MNDPRHFVGRKAELERFREIIDDSKGRAILIVGPEGIGKSTLAHRMLQEASEEHRIPKGTVLRYELTTSESVEATLERALRDAQVLLEDESSLVNTPRRRQQWLALAEVLAGKRGKALTKLLGVLRGPESPRSTPLEQRSCSRSLISKGYSNVKAMAGEFTISCSRPTLANS